MTPNTSSSRPAGPWQGDAAPPPEQPNQGPWSPPREAGPWSPLRAVWNRGPSAGETWRRVGGFVLLGTSLWLVGLIALVRALVGLFS